VSRNLFRNACSFETKCTSRRAFACASLRYHRWILRSVLDLRKAECLWLAQLQATQDRMAPYPDTHAHPDCHHHPRRVARPHRNPRRPLHRQHPRYRPRCHAPPPRTTSHTDLIGGLIGFTRTHRLHIVNGANPSTFSARTRRIAFAQKIGNVECRELSNSASSRWWCMSPALPAEASGISRTRLRRRSWRARSSRTNGGTRRPLPAAAGSHRTPCREARRSTRHKPSPCGTAPQSHRDAGGDDLSLKQHSSPRSTRITSCAATPSTNSRGGTRTRDPGIMRVGGGASVGGF
jgi:hypothetical protein